MIAFGTAMTDPEAYRRYARTPVSRAAEPDSEIFAIAAVGAISRGLNLILEAAAARADLEALVLVAQDVELADPERLCTTVRQALRDPDTAAVGCAGASEVRSIAWWEGAVSAADVSLAYNEFGSGRMPAFAWTDVAPAPARVETLDGSLLVLAPWAVRNVRFDESLVLGHGYDLDYCLQLEKAGKAVHTADIPAIYHRPLEMVDEPHVWIESHMQVAAKWAERLSSHAEGQGWKERARWAEADREGARTIAYSTASLMDARVFPLERELDELAATPSWRFTRPLRAANRWRARTRRAAGGD